MVKRLLLSILLVSCAPDLEGVDTTITAPRLLAVRATPAEVKPGEHVSLEAIVAGGAANIEWSLCRERLPLGETGPIAPPCATGSSSELVALGAGTKIEATIPSDACRLFGPERPNPKPGEPSGRPVDPDSTGGFYQPIRVVVSGSASAFGVRIHCGVPSATPEQAAEIESKSTPNAHPVITGVRVEPVATRSVRIFVDHDAPETYLVFDSSSRAIVERREVLRASFYATGGDFEDARFGDPIQNGWTAPHEGEFTLYTVLRDDRGGVAVSETHVSVK